MGRLERSWCRMPSTARVDCGCGPSRTRWALVPQEACARTPARNTTARSSCTGEQPIRAPARYASQTASTSGTGSRCLCQLVDSRRCLSVSRKLRARWCRISCTMQHTCAALHALRPRGWRSLTSTPRRRPRAPRGLQTALRAQQPPHRARVLPPTPPALHFSIQTLKSVWLRNAVDLLDARTRPSRRPRGRWSRQSKSYAEGRASARCALRGSPGRWLRASAPPLVRCPSSIACLDRPAPPHPSPCPSRLPPDEMFFSRAR